MYGFHFTGSQVEGENGARRSLGSEGRGLGERRSVVPDQQIRCLFLSRIKPISPKTRSRGSSNALHISHYDVGPRTACRTWHEPFLGSPQQPEPLASHNSNAPSLQPTINSPVFPTEPSIAPRRYLALRFGSIYGFGSVLSTATCQTPRQRRDPSGRMSHVGLHINGLSGRGYDFEIAKLKQG